MSMRGAKLFLWTIVAVVAVSLSGTIIRQYRGDAKRQDCHVNLKKIGQAFRFYQTDYNYLPPQAIDRFLTVSLAYGIEPKPCSAFFGLDFGYGDNPLLGHKTSLDELPSFTVLVWDGDEAPPGAMEAWRASPQKPIPKLDRKRHISPHGIRGANMLLADGSAPFFHSGTPPKKLLPFFDPAVSREQTNLTIKED